MSTCGALDPVIDRVVVARISETMPKSVHYATDRAGSRNPHGEAFTPVSRFATGAPGRSQTLRAGTVIY